MRRLVRTAVGYDMDRCPRGEHCHRTRRDRHAAEACASMVRGISWLPPGLERIVDHIDDET